MMKKAEFTIYVNRLRIFDNPRQGMFSNQFSSEQLMPCLANGLKIEGLKR
jgi:hypothetical protein